MIRGAKMAGCGRCLLMTLALTVLTAGKSDSSPKLNLSTQETSSIALGSNTTAELLTRERAETAKDSDRTQQRSGLTRDQANDNTVPRKSLDIVKGRHNEGGELKFHSERTEEKTTQHRRLQPTGFEHHHNSEIPDTSQNIKRSGSLQEANKSHESKPKLEKSNPLLTNASLLQEENRSVQVARHTSQMQKMETMDIDDSSSWSNVSQASSSSSSPDNVETSQGNEHNLEESSSSLLQSNGCFFASIAFINDVVTRIGCCNVITKARVANCSYCNLFNIPTNLPEDIQTLILSHNNISSKDLHSRVFARYSQLTRLRLDYNNISVLPDGVFDGLEKLLVLNLHENSIALNEEFRISHAFHPLNATLSCLILNRNSEDFSKESDYVYPDQALSVLQNLSSLYMDGLTEKEFGRGFSNLTKLTFLNLSGYRYGYCRMVSISNTTFQHLGQIQQLNISNCYLNGSIIETGAFSPLHNLQSLDVSNNFYLGIHALGEIMYGLRNNRNFRYLKMQRIVPRFAPCIVVYQHNLRHLKNMSLEVIEGMDNEIEMIEQGAIPMLPPTLKRLNLTNNKIMFGAYWGDMTSFTALKWLHLDGYVHATAFPNYLPPRDLLCPSRPNVINNDPFINEEGARDVEKSNDGEDSCSDQSGQFMLPFPPNLKEFTMRSSSLAYYVRNIKICPNNSLQNADLSNNVLRKLSGPISGLNKLTNLTIASCFVEDIGETFFDNLTSLLYLDLYQNLLGDCLFNDVEGKVFAKLGQLTYLSVSFNNLHHLHPDSFKNLTNLDNLVVSINRLDSVNFSISHMKRLKNLDLHKNDMKNLPKSAMDHIEKILKSNKVRVDMRQNPIACDCENLDFLEWVVRTRVFGNNYTLYYCNFPDKYQAAVEMPHGYDEVVHRLRRECASNVGLFLSVVGGTLLTVFFIIGLLLYRFRWTLRYWFHAAKLKIYANPQPTSETFDYDVFVSYSSEDTDFILDELSPHLSQERNLRLMIHGEKFQVGRHIADNIYMAVRQCRKTLVLVTRNMLDSHWCIYELQMARMESINTGRNVLVFLFLEEIPTSLMNVDVLSYIKTSTYIAYPDNPQHREAFWDKLADDLRAS